MKELKTHLKYFQATLNGEKNFEWRKEDGEKFELYEVIKLKEYDSDNEIYTGMWIDVRVTYILRGPTFGVPEGYTVLGIKIIKKKWCI